MTKKTTFTFRPGKAVTVMHTILDSAIEYSPKQVAILEAIINGPTKITVEENKIHHTESQRAKYWAELKEWGRELGYSGKESETVLHNAVLCEAFGARDLRHVSDRLIEVPCKRSHDLDIADYSYLIETLDQMIGEHAHAATDDDTDSGIRVHVRDGSASKSGEWREI